MWLYSANQVLLRCKESERPEGPPIVGTLDEMADPLELKMRSSDPFERLDPKDARTAVHSLTVKASMRLEERHLTNTRTRQALGKSQQHLRGIADTPKANLLDLWLFLHDRYKAIQGDCYVQGFSDPQALSWLAEHVSTLCPSPDAWQLHHQLLPMITSCVTWQVSSNLDFTAKAVLQRSTPPIHSHLCTTCRAELLSVEPGMNESAVLCANPA